MTVLPGMLLMVLASLATPPSALADPAYTGNVVLEGDARAEMEELRAKASLVQEQIDELDRELEILTEEYNRAALVLEGTNQDLTELRRKLKLSQIAYRAHMDLLNQRLVSVYKSGEDRMMELLLGSDGLKDFLSRLYLVTRVAMHDIDLIDDLKEEESRVSQLRTEIEERKRDQLELRGDLEVRQEKIEGHLTEREGILASMDGRMAALIEQERRLQETERRRLEEELRAQLSGWEAYEGPLPNTGDAILNQVVETAATYLGIPYVWGGERPSTGLDCSGFTRYVYLQHGVSIPHYSGYQAKTGAPVPPNRIKPGDLVVFGFPVHHVGIYIGADKFIHSPRTGEVISVSRLSARSDLVAVRRFLLESRQAPPLLD